MDQKRLRKRSEACDYLGIRATKLAQLVQTGQIRVIRIGRAVRFEMNELERFVARLREEQ